MNTDELIRQAKLFWELVQEDKIVRYATIAGVAVLWLAIALANVALLGVLPILAASMVLLRRHRDEPSGGAWSDDDLDVL